MKLFPYAALVLFVLVGCAEPAPEEVKPKAEVAGEESFAEPKAPRAQSKSNQKKASTINAKIDPNDDSKADPAVDQNANPQIAIQKPKSQQPKANVQVHPGIPKTGIQILGKKKVTIVKERPPIDEDQFRAKYGHWPNGPVFCEPEQRLYMYLDGCRLYWNRQAGSWWPNDPID